MEVKTVLPQSTQIFDILNPAHTKCRYQKQQTVGGQTL